MRFFAFYQSYKNYKGKLAAFLNSYMNENKNSDIAKIKNFKELFITTLTIANKLSRRFDSKNVAEAIMIGIASNIETLINEDVETLNQMCEDLLEATNVHV